MTTSALPRRVPTAADLREHVPVYAVWELTLACDQACAHCGSRAGQARPRELTLAQCAEVAASLAALGTREVTLIGGEVYLRPDWIDIVRLVHDAGMEVGVQTGGRALDRPALERARDAGLAALGVSFQGHRARHDRLRRVPGLYDRALQAVRDAAAAGLRTAANVQLSRGSLDDLEALADDLLAAGCRSLRVGLVTPMGRAADTDTLLLQPFELLDLVPRVAAIRARCAPRGMAVMADNSLGYFGPFEDELRWSGPEPLRWRGCQAGSTVISVESDGTVKGCPSLPTAPYAERKVTEVALDQTWAHDERVGFTRGRGRRELWGFCASCAYADVCLAGCSFMTHTLLGRRGNQPYCHHRAIELQRQGLRERVVRVEAPPRQPYDFGRWELILEDGAGRRVEGQATDTTPQRDPAWRPGRTPDELHPCPRCRCAVWIDARSCPYCDADIALEHQERARAEAALAGMVGALERALAERPGG